MFCGFFVMLFLLFKNSTECFVLGFVLGKKILKTSIETLAMTITLEMMTLFHQKGCPNIEGQRVVPRCPQEMHYFYLILNKRS